MENRSFLRRMPNSSVAISAGAAKSFSDDSNSAQKGETHEVFSAPATTGPATPQKSSEEIAQGCNLFSSKNQQSLELKLRALEGTKLDPTEWNVRAVENKRTWSPLQRSISAIDLHEAGNFIRTSESWFQDDADRQFEATDDALDHMEISGQFGASRLSESDFHPRFATPNAYFDFESIIVLQPVPRLLPWLCPETIAPLNFYWPDWLMPTEVAGFAIDSAITAMGTACAEFRDSLSEIFGDSVDLGDLNDKEADDFDDEDILCGLSEAGTRSRSVPSVGDFEFPDTVVSAVIKHSSESDMFQWRLVNRQWNSICSAHLRSVKISKVFIIGNEQAEYFMKAIHHPNITIFTSFALEDLTIALNSAAFKFLTRFGPQVDSLELHHVTFSNLAMFLYIISRVPYVKTLALDITSFKGTRLEGCACLDGAMLNLLRDLSFYISPSAGPLTTNFEGFIADFLNFVAPNVWILGVEAPPPPMRSLSSEVYEMLAKCALRCKSIRKFAFELCLSEKLMKSIASARLPLEEVDLVVKEDLVRSSVLYSLLRAVAGTLKWLKLSFRLNNLKLRNAAFELPPFAKLQGLVLDNFFGGPEALGFLQKSQTLKSLDLLGVPHYESMLPARMKALDGMEELRIAPCTYQSMIAFQRILALFPNVTHLYMEEVADFALRGVFMELPKLEVLTLKGHFTDEGITGIPEEKCLEICSFDISTEVDPEYLRLNPSIGDLKKLRRLCIESDKMTDLSITLGVVMCRKLRHLTIAGLLITDQSLKSVASELKQLKHLDMAGCPNVAEDCDQFIGKELDKRVNIVFADGARFSSSSMHEAAAKRVTFGSTQNLQ